MSIDAHVGVGTTVRVELAALGVDPIGEIATGRDAARAVRAEEPLTMENAVRRARVLAVDDDPLGGKDIRSSRTIADGRDGSKSEGVGLVRSSRTRGAEQ